MLLACSQAPPNFLSLVVWKSGPFLLIFRSRTGRAWERGYYAARHTHTLYVGMFPKMLTYLHEHKPHYRHPGQHPEMM